MITCPVTDEPTDTSFEISAIPAASMRPQVLIDCLLCGQDHSWRIDDAFVE
jgi:hypothetical protein